MIVAATMTTMKIKISKRRLSTRMAAASKARAALRVQRRLRSPSTRRSACSTAAAATLTATRRPSIFRWLRFARCLRVAAAPQSRRFSSCRRPLFGGRSPQARHLHRRRRLLLQPPPLRQFCRRRARWPPPPRSFFSAPLAAAAAAAPRLVQRPMWRLVSNARRAVLAKTHQSAAYMQSFAAMSAAVNAAVAAKQQNE